MMSKRRDKESQEPSGLDGPTPKHLMQSPSLSPTSCAHVRFCQSLVVVLAKQLQPTDTTALDKEVIAYRC